MRRLKDLDVHEISLVKRAANKRRYLIVKSDTGVSSMATPQAAPKANAAQDLLAAMASIPREKLEHIAAIAKSAKSRVHKADGDAPEGDMSPDDVLPEDAQNALKAAFRILAPYAEAISAGTMADFADALGVEADADDADVDGDVDGDVAMSDGADDEDEVGKADDAPAADADKLDAMAKADAEEEDDADKAAKSDEAKDEVEGEDVPPSVAKADGMPDFADATDADKEAAMAAARTAYADAMKQRGIQEAAQKADEQEDDEDDALAKSGVEKSAFSLKGLSDKQRKVLEPVLKSHFDRFAELERANRELIAKSEKLDEEMQRREFIAKAAKEFGALGRPEEIGESLMRLHKKDPDGVDSWCRIMKAANEQMLHGGADGLFKELGTAMGNAQATGGDAYAKIQQHVDGLVQKSAAGKTREQIEAEFLSTPAGRRLYAEANRN